jgi:hypothetical protein
MNISEKILKMFKRLFGQTAYEKHMSTMLTEKEMQKVKPFYLKPVKSRE